jgi:hypothetical protein
MRVEKPKRNEVEQLHTTKLKMAHSRDYVPVVNVVDQDILWLIMVTVSLVDIAV